jgi:hypothetical protein
MWPAAFGISMNVSSWIKLLELEAASSHPPSANIKYSGGISPLPHTL